jgi:hypothetical protein
MIVSTKVNVRKTDLVGLVNGRKALMFLYDVSMGPLTLLYKSNTSLFGTFKRTFVDLVLERRTEIDLMYWDYGEIISLAKFS